MFVRTLALLAVSAAILGCTRSSGEPSSFDLAIQLDLTTSADDFAAPLDMAAAIDIASPTPDLRTSDMTMRDMKAPPPATLVFTPAE